MSQTQSLAQRILLISIAILAGIAGSLAYRWWSQPDYLADPMALASAVGQAGAAELIGSQRPDYTLGSSTGERVSAFEFDGLVVLVNFWATWCQPCREEMPMLAGLQQELQPQGFEVVGIALDDVAQAREFAESLGIEYPILVGSTDVMAVSNLYGNRSGTLPYSVLLDREGIIRWTHLGELKEKTLREQILEVLGQGQTPAD